MPGRFQDLPGRQHRQYRYRRCARGATDSDDVGNAYKLRRQAAGHRPVCK